MIEQFTPNLMVSDVKASISFYQEILNCDVYDFVEVEGIYTFAILGCDGFTLMLEEKETLIEEYPSLETKTIKPSLTLFIKVMDVLSEYERLKSHPNLVKPLNTTFYGTQEFALLDPDGVVLTFAGAAL